MDVIPEQRETDGLFRFIHITADADAPSRLVLCFRLGLCFGLSLASPPSHLRLFPRRLPPLPPPPSALRSQSSSLASFTLQHVVSLIFSLCPYLALCVCLSVSPGLISPDFINTPSLLSVLSSFTLCSPLLLLSPPSPPPHLHSHPVDG